MSDAEAAVDAADDADPEEASHEDGDQPDAADLPQPDGLADLPDPEEVEEDAGADADTTAEGEKPDGDEPEESDGSDTPAPSGDTMGDLYCQSLVALTNALIEQHGDPDAEAVDVEAARQLDIDHHFDRLMDEMGMGRDLPPGQAVLLSSTVFVGSNVLAKTDVASEMVGDLGDLEL